MVLYSRADTWLGWGETREADRPLTSLGRIFQLSFHGSGKAIRGLMKTKKGPPKGKLATSIVPLLLLIVLLQRSASLSAQVASGKETHAGASAVPAAPAHSTTSSLWPTSVYPTPSCCMASMPTHRPLFTAADPGRQNRDHASALSLFTWSDPVSQPSQGEPERHALRDSAGQCEPAPIAQPAPGQTTSAQHHPHENNTLLEATLTLPAEMLVRNNSSPSSSLATTPWSAKIHPTPRSGVTSTPRRRSSWQVRCFPCTTTSNCCRYLSTIPWSICAR